MFAVDINTSLGYESYVPCISAGWRNAVETARQRETEEHNKDAETKG
jgi:hypothetical protein